MGNVRVDGCTGDVDGVGLGKQVRVRDVQGSWETVEVKGGDGV